MNRDKKCVLNTRRVFITYIAIGILLYISILFITNGGYMAMLLERGGSYFDDITRPLSAFFMYDNVYEGGRDMCFPPLAYSIYGILARIMQFLSLDTQLSIATDRTGIFLCALVMSINVCAVIASFNHFYPGTKLEKLLLALLLPFTFPFIIVFNQGNGILIALPFILASVCMKDSESKVKRELALIFLAIAAGIKIYPAILGLLWLKEKRWKEVLRLIIYGIVFFFGPYVFFGGLYGIQLHLHNLSQLNGLESIQYQSSQDITAMTIFLLQRFMSAETAYMIGKYLSYGYFVITIVLFFLRKMNWKSIALLTTLMVIFVAPSNSYTYLYYLVPLLFLFKETEQGATIKEYLYVILIAMIFCIWPIVIYRAYMMTAAAYLFVIVLIIDSVVDIIRDKQAQSSKKDTEHLPS